MQATRRTALNPGSLGVAQYFGERRHCTARFVQFISKLPESSTLTFGYTGAGKRITRTSASHKHGDILNLLLKVASTSLGIRQLVAIRVSNNASNLKAFPFASSNTIVYWHRREPQHTMTYESPPGHISLANLAGKQWLGIQCIQILHGSSSDLLLDVEAGDTPTQRTDPGVPADTSAQVGNLPTSKETSEEGSERLLSGQPLPPTECVEDPSMVYEEPISDDFRDYLIYAANKPSKTKTNNKSNSNSKTSNENNNNEINNDNSQQKQPTLIGIASQITSVFQETRGICASNAAAASNADSSQIAPVSEDARENCENNAAATSTDNASPTAPVS